MAKERLRSGEVSALITLEGAFIGLRYRDEVVRNHITQFIQKHGQGFVLQQDSVSPHVAISMQIEFHVRAIDTLA